MSSLNSNLPEFSSSGVVIEPNNTKKQNGWVSGEKPAYQYMNWIHKTTSDWIEHIDPFWSDIDELKADKIIGFSGTGVNVEDCIYVDESSNGAPVLSVGNPTIHAFSSTHSALQIGGLGNILTEKTPVVGGSFGITQNSYWNGSISQYIINDEAVLYNQNSGNHIFYSAPAGTGAISWTEISRAGLSSNGAPVLSVGKSTIENVASNFSSMQLGGTGQLMSDTNEAAGGSMQMSQNAYFDGNWKYIVTDYASSYYQYGGNHFFAIGNSGSADTTINGTGNLTTVAKINGSGIYNYNNLYEQRVSNAGNTIGMGVFSTTSTHHNYLTMQKTSNNTIGSYTATANGEYIGVIDFQGSVTGGFQYGARILAQQVGAVGTYVPTDLIFYTSSSSSALVETLRLKSDGDVSMPGGLSRNGQPVLNCKIIDIGDWNMVSSHVVGISHGLGSDFKKIRNISVIVRNDTDDQYFNLYYFQDATDPTMLAGGVYYINTTNIYLNRRTGGNFDNTSFDSTSYNRGWIYIEYIN